ncbi:MAG: cell division protein SepF [Synechococcaceae cyanobacterium]|nr:cell division protein SepF [Synechococcaceae cyanobacterium]
MATPRSEDGSASTLTTGRDAVIPLALGQPHRVLIMAPAGFDDGAEVIASVRDGHTVLVNVNGLEEEPGQRLIDYVCGGVTALDGQSHRLDDRVFLFAPALVTISTP